MFLKVTPRAQFLMPIADIYRPRAARRTTLSLSGNDVASLEATRAQLASALGRSVSAAEAIRVAVQFLRYCNCVVQSGMTGGKHPDKEVAGKM